MIIVWQVVTDLTVHFSSISPVNVSISSNSHVRRGTRTIVYLVFVHILAKIFKSKVSRFCRKKVCFSVDWVHVSGDIADHALLHIRQAFLARKKTTKNVLKVQVFATARKSVTCQSWLYSTVVKNLTVVNLTVVADSYSAPRLTVMNIFEYALNQLDRHRSGHNPAWSIWKWTSLCWSTSWTIRANCLLIWALCSTLSINYYRNLLH